MKNQIALIVPSSSAFPAELAAVAPQADYRFVTIGEHTALRHVRREDLPLLERYPDGHLSSCAAVYLISEEEGDALRGLDAERKAEAERREIAELRPVMERTVERAKAQGGAMTPEAALKAAREYNERHNDGGFGYTPRFIVVDELARAEKWLAEHPEH